jgi:uncharacterized protein YjiS (DUF1127 family)
MTSLSTTYVARGSPSRAAVPASFVRFLARIVSAIAAKCRRGRELRELACLSDHQLKDIRLARVGSTHVVRFGSFE